MTTLTKKFKDISLADLPEVGGKNSSLGEMFNKLAVREILVPDGFATTAMAFWTFLDNNKLRQQLRQLLNTLDKKTFSNLKEVGRTARELILHDSGVGNSLPYLFHLIERMYSANCYFFASCLIEERIRPSLTKKQSSPNSLFEMLPGMKSQKISRIS